MSDALSQIRDPNRQPQATSHQPAAAAGAGMDAGQPEQPPAPVAPSPPGRLEPAADDGQPAGSRRLSATEFTLETDGFGLIPHQGWRRLLYELTGGRWNPGPSATEQHDRTLHAAVTTSLSRQVRILLACCKGGVGKTTLCALLGHMFARLRGDHVVALDCNPDAGSLASRIPRQTSRTITDLLRDAETIDSYAALRGYTSQATSRLEVIASHRDPRTSRALTGADYQRAIRLLEQYYTIILLDAGTGLLDSATQGGLEVADQLVVPLSPSLDETHVAAQTLDWLDEHGYGHLVAGAVAVINQASGDEAPRIVEHFAARCAQVVRIPFDPYLALGGDTAVEELAPATQRAVLELAAAVAARFNQPPRPIPPVDDPHPSEQPT